MRTLLAKLATATALLAAAPALAAPPGQPNVLILMVDDLDVASFQTLLDGGWLPNIQRRILDQGTRFTNHFVTNSLCCPSRATMLTGQYSHNHGVTDVSIGLRHWLTPDLQPKGEYETLATWLQASGYYTGHVGKYLNGYGMPPVAPEYVPPGYDDWQALVDPYTYQVYDYHLNDNGVVRAYGHRPEEYQTDELARRAVRFLDDHETRAADKPFFLVLTPVAPHVELRTRDVILDDTIGYRAHFRETIRPAPRHRATVLQFPGPPMGAAFDEADVSDKPPFVQGLPRLVRAFGDHRAVDRQWRERLAAMLAVDELVATVTGRLEKAGELESTVLVFTSDNGYLFGEHRASSKMFAYEESIRVPFAMRGPGIVKGATVDATVLNNDLAPTLASFTGLRATRESDGRSLGGLLAGGEATTGRACFLVEHYRESKVIMKGLDVLSDLPPPPFKALRCDGEAGAYLYAEWHDDEARPDAVTFREYYDLAADPAQLRNAVNDLAPAEAAALAAKLHELEACKGASCRLAEDAAPR